MDESYAQTVRLLLAVAPAVFTNDIFAMKGGTAINLFVRDLPRLSVDIDVAYLPWKTPREEALASIAAELEAIAGRLARFDLRTRTIATKGLNDTKLLVSNGVHQVVVEVNVVFRGSVLPPERRMLTPATAEMFSTEVEVTTLAPDELYGSKIVAALDRQHPRDLFDIWKLFESDGMSDPAIECFVTYLAGHNRPPHEVLFGNDKDVTASYENAFVGMTTEPVQMETLLAARARLRTELMDRITNRQRQFLVGLSRADPDWTLLDCPHAASLPALRWKLENLQKFREKRPLDFEQQAQMLERALA